MLHGLALPSRRRACAALALLATAGRALLVAPAARKPVMLGLDGEFGLDNSVSAQAVELGMRAAIEEVNAAGGVLGGRPLELVIKDHRSIPARGIRNIEEFARMPDLVAVFGGRFSPVVIEELPVIKSTRTLFMDPWAAADEIVDNDMRPNYVFRLSLRDSLAVTRLMASAKQRGLTRVGLLLTNTSWGRSSEDSAKRYLAGDRGMRLVHTAWYNWRDTSLVAKYRELLAAGAQAVVLVANDDEAAILVREIAKVARFLASAGRVSPVRRIEDIRGPVGAAHAYDLTHILALAIDMAGSTERKAVRDALERVPAYDGLVKRYAPPFTPARHDALDARDLLLARYRPDGALVPVGT